MLFALLHVHHLPLLPAPIPCLAIHTATHFLSHTPHTSLIAVPLPSLPAGKFLCLTFPPAAGCCHHTYHLHTFVLLPPPTCLTFYIFLFMFSWFFCSAFFLYFYTHTCLLHIFSVLLTCTRIWWFHGLGSCYGWVLSSSFSCIVVLCWFCALYIFAHTLFIPGLMMIYDDNDSDIDMVKAVVMGDNQIMMVIKSPSLPLPIKSLQ